MGLEVEVDPNLANEAKNPIIGRAVRGCEILLSQRVRSIGSFKSYAVSGFKIGALEQPIYDFTDGIYKINMDQAVLFVEIATLDSGAAGIRLLAARRITDLSKEWAKMDEGHDEALRRSNARRK